MTEPSVDHSTFVIERVYPVAPKRVFAAYSDPVKKRRWMVEGEGFTVESSEMDFRVEGEERSRFRFKGGPLIKCDAAYQDIVPDRRIVLVYTMTVGDKRISSSLSTTEFLPDREGTRLIYTEQAAFFDGADGARGREEGCRELLEQLAKELRRPD